MHDDGFFHPFARPWWMPVMDFLTRRGHEILIASFGVLTVANVYLERWATAFTFGAVVMCVSLNMYALKVLRDIWQMEGRFDILRSFSDARREGRDIDQWEAAQWEAAIRATQRSHRHEEP